MAHSYEELKHKTVAELREIASGIEHEAVQGYTQLNKALLIKALCTALDIDSHEHHEVVGIDKAAMKKRIQAMKEKRNKILLSDDRSELKATLRHIHRLKRQIHKATV